MAILSNVILQASASSREPAPVEPAADLEGCIVNISPREQRKRLLGGVIQFAVSLAVLAALIGYGADRWWRIGLFMLFWGAAAGFFQWREKT